MKSILAASLRRALAETDVDGLLRLWPTMFPAYPPPQNREDALRTLHLARTGTSAISMSLRQYSHRWLKERGFPSALPEKDWPVEKVGVVGIAVRSSYPEVAKAIRGVMEHAVMDAYADGRRDPDFIRGRMFEARKRERKALGLRPL